MPSNYFFTVRSEYISELGLRGNELLTYSLISSFPDGWKLSLSRTAEVLGISRRSYAAAIASLRERGLVAEVETEEGRALTAYTGAKNALVQNLHQCKICTDAGAEFAPAVVQKLHHYNNNNNNININKRECDTRARDTEENIGQEKEKENATDLIGQDEYRKKKVAPKKKEPAPRVFRPPTEAEVAAYIVEKGWEVNAARWHAYYESNGWRVGKNKMKDWKAAVKNWQYNGIDNKNEKNEKNEKTTRNNFSGDYAACCATL